MNLCSDMCFKSDLYSQTVHCFSTLFLLGLVGDCCGAYPLSKRIDDYVSTGGGHPNEISLLSDSIISTFIAMLIAFCNMQIFCNPILSWVATFKLIVNLATLWFCVLYTWIIWHDLQSCENCMISKLESILLLYPDICIFYNSITLIGLNILCVLSNFVIVILFVNMFTAYKLEVELWNGTGDFVLWHQKMRALLLQ